MGVKIAGEIAAWSAGAATTESDNDGLINDNGGVLNGNGVEKLVGRTAPVTDMTVLGPVIGLTKRICATASIGTEAEARHSERVSATILIFYFFNLYRAHSWRIAVPMVQRTRMAAPPIQTMLGMM